MSIFAGMDYLLLMCTALESVLPLYVKNHLLNSILIIWPLCEYESLMM